MRRAHACARVLYPIPQNGNRTMVSPADADLLISSLKHMSCLETEYVDVEKVITLLRHVSCLEDDCVEFREEIWESKTVKSRMSSCYQRTTRRDNLTVFMGKSGCDDEYSSRSSDYSDMQSDSTWGPEGEKQVEISSEKPAISSRSGEEVSSKNSVDHGEGSESGKGRPEGRYRCSVCGVLHLKPSLLKQHMRTHSEDGAMQQNPKAYQIPYRTLKSRCLGPVQFWRVTPSMELAGARSFVCPVENCGRQYKRQDHLNRHSLTHKGNLFVCTWVGCDLAFNVSSNLQRHLRLHEKWGSNLLRGSKIPDACLTCPEAGCGKSFKYKSLLQTHIENVHESLSVTQAVCVEPCCGTIFDNPQLLKIHTKAAHSFVFCETCGVSMLKKSLAVHIRKHEGERELMRCPHPGCLHSYYKKSNLDTHVRAIHLNLKPYACSHAGCEMRFAYKAVRDKHELCSSHVKPVLEGDFETEDSEFRLKSRGGRKRPTLHHVDDLLPRKYRSQPPE